MFSFNETFFRIKTGLKSQRNKIVWYIAFTRWGIHLSEISGQCFKRQEFLTPASEIPNY